MPQRMRRILSFLILMLSFAEVLLLHWASFAWWGRGLSLPVALGLGVGLGFMNYMTFPLARRFIHADGLAVLASRTWIFGSIAALMSGLAMALLIFSVNVAGGISGDPDAMQPAFFWLGGLIVVLGYGSVFWGATVGNQRVDVDQLSLALPGLSSGGERLSVVHITDLHIGPLLDAERLASFVERINGLDADLIAITGDIFDFDPRYVEMGCRGLSKLTAKHGVFAVLGNHDVYTGAEIVAQGLAEFTTIRLLRDDFEQIDYPGGSLVIAGVEDTGEGWTERHAECPALEELSQRIPDAHPCLLLSHRPSYFNHAERLGFRLMLAGHTHGGQVSLPFANNHNPSRVISDRTRGVFRRGDATLYVNRGLGMAGLPLRINCPREIALIELAP
jgi:predicted MPP superfamily phosphohydrolase